jgi:hypothetical protein
MHKFLNRINTNIEFFFLQFFTFWEIVNLCYRKCMLLSQKYFIFVCAYESKKRILRSLTHWLDQKISY